MKKLCFLLIFTLLFSACRKQEQGTNTPKEMVTLNVYGLFDPEEYYATAFQAFQKENPHVTIQYKKFTNAEAYMDLIVNELAEGDGPDIFFLKNTDFPKHYKKLQPAPDTLVNPEVFRQKFVQVAGDDLIIPDEKNIEKVWGIPVYVDTLALYYNDAHYEDAIPSRGEPPRTWSSLKDDVSLLNKADQSFERFERSGLALGRVDNTLRTLDVLKLLLLQSTDALYSEDLKKVLWSANPGVNLALDYLVSFALPSQNNYSWNKVLADANSGTKEITTFVNGKVSMIFGYSYLYETIADELKRQEQKGLKVISMKDVKIAPIPQWEDPQLSPNARLALASYYAPVVSRTSTHPDLAWGLMAKMTDEAFLKKYYEQTHRPSALRTLIQSQMQDPVYGVFASQVGFAKSFLTHDEEAVNKLLAEAVQRLLATARLEDVITNLSNELQSITPVKGIKPVYRAP